MRKAAPKVFLAKERRAIFDEEFKKQKVELSDTGVTDNQLKYCAEKVVHYIKQLELNHNAITCAGIFCLINLKWKNLVRIELMSNRIGNKGCKYLSRIKSTLLEQIFLNNNQICEAGMIHLCKAEWKNIKFVILYCNRIGFGVMPLVKANWMFTTQLHLSWNNLEKQKTITLLLGQWKNVKTISLLQEGEEIQADYQTFSKKFKRFGSFNVVKMIRHMTS